ncbi:MAG: HDOD domain-containing protein [Trichlorobacter sp.]|jgi:HD-like signal output (HDOD) protein
MAFADGPVYTLEWLVDRTSTVYSLPLFYEQLNEAINHPRTSIDDIAKIITEDQGLTARLLRLANSPFFGWFGKVDSINKAVTIIGTQQLRDLALAASVMGVFTGIPEELLNMISFWRHSVACGILARTLATWRRETNVERFFVAGILHDVGQLMMATTIPPVVMEMIGQSRASNQPYHLTELDRLGFDHADAGGALLRSWKIPANIAEPVASHHRPSRAEQFPVEAATIHLSDIICQAMEYGQTGEWCVPALDPAAWDKLGMSPHQLGAILKQAEPQLEETFSILAEAP